MKKNLLVLLAILLIKIGYSQTNMDSTSSEVNRRLHIIGKEDQRVRATFLKKLSSDSLFKQMALVDSINEIYVLQLLENNGWNKYELDSSSDAAIFLVLIHLGKKHVKEMEKYAPLVKEKASAGKIEMSDYATYFDRICMYKNEPQYYGNQTIKIGKDIYVWPIKDVANVEKRRSEMELPDMDSYIGIMKSMTNKTVIYQKNMSIKEINELKKINKGKD